jgi:hypothetical protein
MREYDHTIVVQKKTTMIWWQIKRNIYIKTKIWVILINSRSKLTLNWMKKAEGIYSNLAIIIIHHQNLFSIL